MAKGALNLLREMERKYVRAIEQMKGDDLVVRPPMRALRKLEEDLEKARQNIRELEAAEARGRKATTQRRKPAPG